MSKLVHNLNLERSFEWREEEAIELLDKGIDVSMETIPTSMIFVLDVGIGDCPDVFRMVEEDEDEATNVLCTIAEMCVSEEYGKVADMCNPNIMVYEDGKLLRFTLEFMAA